MTWPRGLRRLTDLLAGAGVGIGLLLWHPALTLFALVALVVSGVVVGLAVAATRELPFSLVAVAVASLRWSSAALGLVALIDLSPWLAELAVLVWLCVGLVGLLARRTTRQPAAHQALSELSDRELCLLWRRTLGDLHHQTDSLDVLLVVAFRQGCLDEFERRDPAGFHAWLAAGERALETPEQFLHLRPHDGTNGAG